MFIWRRYETNVEFQPELLTLWIEISAVWLKSYTANAGQISQAAFITYGTVIVHREL